MVAIAMGKKKSPTTLKVDRPEQEMISKIAAHRRLSIEGLFKEKDVKDFFTHLLLEEMRKETEHLKGKR